MSERAERILDVLLARMPEAIRPFILQKRSMYVAVIDETFPGLSSGIPEKYLVTFRDGSTKPVWLITGYAYQAVHNCTSPGIFLHCSPAQYAGMSKRQQAQYRNEQRRERGQASDCAERWRQLVWEAYQEGLFTLQTPGIDAPAGWFNDNARSAILGKLIDQDKQREEAFFARLSRYNRQVADAGIGEVVYEGVTSRYAVVDHKYAVSFRLRYKEDRELTWKSGLCSWLHYNEIKSLMKERPDLADEGVLVADVIQALRDKAWDQGVLIGLVGQTEAHPAPKPPVVQKPAAVAVAPAEVPVATAPFTFTGLKIYSDSAKAMVDYPNVIIERWVNEATVSDYPYGRHRTEAKWYLETAAKGEHIGKTRVCRVTKDPKTGRWNAPHCTTYSDEIRLGVAENGHVFWIKHHRLSERLEFYRGDETRLGDWYGSNPDAGIAAEFERIISAVQFTPIDPVVKARYQAVRRQVFVE